MNRKPSTYVSAPARDIANPAPLRAKLRLVRGGPYVAAEIRRDAEGWSAWMDGHLLARVPDHPENCREIMHIWQFGRDVTKYEWLGLNRPGRNVDARTPINLNEKESLF